MNQPEPKQISVSRTFEALLELLWKAWTEPEHFMQWYGPRGFTTPHCEIDLRVGRRHLWSMRSPDGNEMFFTGEYTEVEPMKRLVFTDAMSDSEGNAMPGMGAMEVTVAFSHAGGRTTVTVSHMGMEGAAMGWEQALDKLQEILTGS